MNHAETPKHQTQSAELYQAVLEEDAQLNAVDAQNPAGIVDVAANKIDHLLAKHDVKRAERAAKKDYRQNQGDYQNEALHDAIREGVEVNVPEPDTRIKYPGVAERIAYAGKDSMDEAVRMRNEELPKAEDKLAGFLVKAATEDPGWMSAAEAAQDLVNVKKARIAQEKRHAEQSWRWAEEDEAERSAKRKAQRQARAQRTNKASLA